MNLFGITAYAAEKAPTQGGAGGTLGMILPLVLIFAVMYFLMIRPQKKKEKLKEMMLSQIIHGDKVLTIGGIHGKIVSIKDDNIILETGDSSNKSYLKICRWAVGEVTKPGDETKAVKEATENKEESTQKEDKKKEDK